MENNSGRISREQMFMEIAHIIAKRSTCARLKVGAVIAKDNRIISTGYNGVVGKQPNDMCECMTEVPCTHAVHAEANAIAFAARMGLPIRGSALYLTHSPCKYCCDLIIQSGIIKVVYGTLYRVDSTDYLIKNGVQCVKCLEDLCQLPDTK